MLLVLVDMAEAGDLPLPRVAYDLYLTQRYRSSVQYPALLNHFPQSAQADFAGLGATSVAGRIIRRSSDGAALANGKPPKRKAETAASRAAYFPVTDTPAP